MTELQLTHAFVRNLTRGIRDAYGRDELRQSDVLKVIAKAAGREPGAMMHALKTASKSETEREQDTPKVQFCTFGLTVKLLDACKSRDDSQIKMIADMLSPDTAFAKLALSLANYCRSEPWTAEYFLLEALMEDRMWLELIASEIGACAYPADAIHAFGHEQYGPTWDSELLGGSIIPSAFRVWAAHAAIYAGLLRFVGAQAVFPQADLSKDSHIDKLRKRMKK
jgi:hypothetical protein